MSALYSQTHFAEMMQTQSGLKIYRLCSVDFGVWGFPQQAHVAHFAKMSHMPCLLLLSMGVDNYYRNMYVFFQNNTFRHDSGLLELKSHLLESVYAICYS